MRRIILLALFLLFTSAITNSEDIFNSDIYITEESLFANKLEQALSFELEERYDEALTVYINLLNKLDKIETNEQDAENANHHVFYQANLYKDIYDKKTLFGRYLTVKGFVLGQIAELPIEVRKRYQRLISGKSDILFTDAIRTRNKRAIQQIAENYFLAENGYEYLFHAGRLAFESADFALCAYYLEKLFDYWNDEFSENSLNILYLASSYVGSGDFYKFENFKRSASSHYKGLSITINSTVYNDVTELLTVEKLRKLILNNLKNTDTILRWGSDLKNSDLQFDFEKFTGSTVNISTPNDSGSNSRSNFRRKTIIRGFGSGNDPNEPVNMMIPAFSKDKIIVANDDTVQQIKFENNEISKTISKIKYPESIYFPRNKFSGKDVYKNSIVVTGRYAYGVFDKGEEKSNNYYYYPSYQTARGKVLTCIDLEDNNKVVWWVPGQAEELDLEKFNDIPIQFLSEVGIDNSFVLNDNRLYAAGIYPDDQEAIYYIMSFDATPDDKTGGSLLWKTKIATELKASWGGYRENRSMPPFTLKYYSGFLYVLTNAGIFACLDTSTGNIKYINRYMRPKNISSPDSQRSWGWGSNYQPLQGTHWQYNPIIVHKGFVYITPIDSRKMYVINAQSGELVREFPYGTEPVDDYLYILGVSNDTLHIQGKKRCYGLNLKLDHDPNSESAQNYELFSYKTVPFNIFGMIEKTTGRGVLGSKYLYIPTRKGIIKFDSKSGKRMNEMLKWKNLQGTPTSSNTSMGGDLYLYKTSKKQYLVSVSFDMLVLIPVE
ncbi:MAG: hypothetical protein K8S87_00240 [Planctomycetes bacterium]|nr:hypothetical protein [Planctomycetota bacterium]